MTHSYIIFSYFYKRKALGEIFVELFTKIETMFNLQLNIYLLLLIIILGLSIAEKM